MKKQVATKFMSMLAAFVLVFTMLLPSGVGQATEKHLLKADLQDESTLELKAAIAEQQRLSMSGPILDARLMNVKDTEEVEVIVHLSKAPVALEKGKSELKGKAFSNARANEVRANVIAQQNKVKKELKTKAVSFTTEFEYNTVLNGFSAKVKGKDLAKLIEIEDVTLIEPNTTLYAMEEAELVESTPSTVDLMMNTSNSFLGIEKLWQEGYEGQGIKVAVLDTGIDPDHPEFQGIYKGGKNFIPYTSTYTAPRASDDASETRPSERPAHVPEFNANGSSFYTSHGTHVAGTIAAIGANEFGIKGIAPKIDLYAYRVLGAYGSGSTAGIIAAIEESVIQEMDVINLSLGGGANSETDAGSFAINNAMMAGTISVIATGNSGPNRGTMGTPATARLGIAVGNTTNPEAKYSGEVTVTVGDYTYSERLQLMGTTFGQNLSTQLDGEFELVAVPGVGKPEDFEGIDVAGKVALISRGEIAFVDKIANAKANGAIATMIHNFAGGTGAPGASGVFLGDSFSFLPTFDMSQTAGEELRMALQAGTGIVQFGHFESTMTAGDEVNDSSSRGPSKPNFDIKPDVSAPGTNIMSTIPMYKSDFPNADYSEAYDRKTGTSMATPHIAGIAALIKQANPDWNAFDVKVALSNTAKILDTTKYDVFAQGAGRVNAYAAAHPEILAYALDTAVLDGTGQVVENIKGTVTFGPQSLKENISVTKQIKVKDMKGSGGEYAVTVDTTKSFGDAQVTVDQSEFSLNGEVMLNVTLTASAATTKAGDEILGYIKIMGDDIEISLPFAADFGTAKQAEVHSMSISETDLSFDGDGNKDSAVLNFTITEDVGFNTVEIWDIMNPSGGQYGDGYIGYLHAASTLAAGSYTLNINGEYQPWDSSPKTTIPDGLYTIDFTARSGDSRIVDFAGPVVVKTSKPVITGQLEENQVSGQVDDAYLLYNAELEKYGLSFDLNEKLNASYVATIDGVDQQPESLTLAADGTFEFTVTPETSKVKVVVEDATGNVGEYVVFEREIQKPVTTLVIDHSVVELSSGETTAFTVKEVTNAYGEVTETDVTHLATYTIQHKNVATISNGIIKAKKKGETIVFVQYGDYLETFTIRVVDKKKKK